MRAGCHQSPRGVSAGGGTAPLSFFGRCFSVFDATDVTDDSSASTADIARPPAEPTPPPAPLAVTNMDSQYGYLGFDVYGVPKCKGMLATHDMGDSIGLIFLYGAEESESCGEWRTITGSGGAACAC